MSFKTEAVVWPQDFELISCFVGPEWVSLLALNILFPFPAQKVQVQPADQRSPSGKVDPAVPQDVSSS